MIAQMIDGPPRVARFEGNIAVIATDEGVDHGFLLSPTLAISTAASILSAVADQVGRDRFTLPIDAVELTGGATDGVERYEGAPLAVELSATQVAELAAGFTAAAKALDEPQLPGG